MRALRRLAIKADRAHLVRAGLRKQHVLRLADLMTACSTLYGGPFEQTTPCVVTKLPC